MSTHHVPKSRLNEIAFRKLQALGIPAGLGSDRQTLQGMLHGPALSEGPGLVNHLTGKRVDRVAFVVEAHDKLRPVDPPALRGLRPVLFYDAEHATEVVRRLSEEVSRRVGAVQQLSASLRNKGVPHDVDGERLVVVAKPALLGVGTVVVEGNEAGIFARALMRDVGEPVKLGDLPLDPDAFEDRPDFEIYVEDRVQQALKSRRGPGSDERATGAAQAHSTGRRVSAGPPPPPDALTVELLAAKLGAGAAMTTGFGLTRDLLVDGLPVRFEARHVQGRTFQGRVLSSHGLAWEDTFDLDRFPGVEPFVVGLLAHVPARAPSAPAPGAAPAPPPHPELSAGEMPVAGETWVMDVRILPGEGDEVRYKALNVHGDVFGAPRVLKRAAFEQAFVEVSPGSWRLFVEVLAVEGGAVTYRPLDARRQAAGGPRRIGLPAFVSSFIAEAAAY